MSLRGIFIEDIIDSVRRGCVPHECLNVNFVFVAGKRNRRARLGAYWL